LLDLKHGAVSHSRGPETAMTVEPARPVRSRTECTSPQWCALVASEPTTFTVMTRLPARQSSRPVTGRLRNGSQTAVADQIALSRRW